MSYDELQKKAEEEDMAQAAEVEAMRVCNSCNYIVCLRTCKNRMQYFSSALTIYIIQFTPILYRI